MSVFGALQVALGVALIAAGPLVGGPAWALVWPGAAVLFIGAGYLGLGPRVFGKRAEDGRMSPWLVLLIWPYSAVAWTLWQLKSRLFGEAAHHEVAPGLHVGRRPLHALEVPEGTRVVVDLTSEFGRSEWPGESARYVCVPTLDTSVPPGDALAALVDLLADEEGPMLIHCAMGHGRSAMVAAALMIRRGHAVDVDDAIRKMRAPRPGVRLHGAQRAAVERLSARAAVTPAAARNTL